MTSISENVHILLRELHGKAGLVAAAKSRSVEEIQEAIRAGVTIIGQNYVQEAFRAYQVIGEQVKWHFIGHLQKNKIQKAVQIFDCIETVDSVEIAEEINAHAQKHNKIMSLFIEINSGREPQKYGVLPEDIEEFAERSCSFKNISIDGVMTMGPFLLDPEEYRPFFKETKGVFDVLRKMNLANADLRYLSMGMSDSYKIAIEEGANLVRIGTRIFGPRG